MNNIRIEKKANGYLVEIDANYKVDDSEDETFIYKTKEEVVQALPEVMQRAIDKCEEEKEMLKEQKKQR